MRNFPFPNSVWDQHSQHYRNHNKVLFLRKSIIVLVMCYPLTLFTQASVYKYIVESLSFYIFTVLQPLLSNNNIISLCKRSRLFKKTSANSCCIFLFFVCFSLLSTWTGFCVSHREMIFNLRYCAIYFIIVCALNMEQCHNDFFIDLKL